MEAGDWIPAFAGMTVWLDCLSADLVVWRGPIVYYRLY